MKTSTLRVAIALSVLPILAVGCGKKKTADTTVATTVAAAPADTGAAAPADTAAAAPADTAAAATTVAAPSAASDTTVAAH